MDGWFTLGKKFFYCVPWPTRNTNMFNLFDFTVWKIRLQNNANKNFTVTRQSETRVNEFTFRADWYRVVILIYHICFVVPHSTRVKVKTFRFYVFEMWDKNSNASAIVSELNFIIDNKIIIYSLARGFNSLFHETKKFKVLNENTDNINYTRYLGEFRGKKKKTKLKALNLHYTLGGASINKMEKKPRLRV